MNHSTNVSALEESSIFDETLLRMLDEPFELNRSKLRDDANYVGFDNNAGDTWIYPTNYTVRQYQYNIIKKALFTNTLVVLPTGLGKTFIAAVVMYNIYRWYPTGKVIFMAPTRPLVAQQIEACYHIMGIPKEDTVEITGQKQKSMRATMWQTKRVFFVTPQALMSDLCDPQNSFPVSAVKLMVIDEAHRAKGRYAYTEVVQSIMSRNNSVRVLALSATPGRRIEDVVEVVRNLFISHIEVRWENSIDVSPFVHRRKIKTIVVPFDKNLSGIRDEFIEIIDPYVRNLSDFGVVTGSVGSLNKNWLLMEQKRFREMSITQRHPQHSTVTSNFSAAISLYHALDCLERHGIRIFMNFFDDTRNSTEQKYFVNKDFTLKNFLEKIRNEIGPNPFQLSDDSAANSSLIEAPEGMDFGHPKFELLQKNLMQHFEGNPDSRAIVFCELRESVLLIQKSLQRCRPLLKPRMFVGQGSSNSIRAVTQKQQIAVMNEFRTGASNILIATCVAEEGIDVGEVDLIICFDISNKNPTRLVQRMGRTGRKRDGQVIMLVTEGREHDVLRDALANKDKTNKKIAHSNEIRNALYKKSSRLVPPEFDPQCLEAFIKLPDEEVVQATTSKKAKEKKVVEKKPPTRKVQKRKNEPEKGTQDVRNFFTKKSKNKSTDRIEEAPSESQNDFQVIDVESTELQVEVDGEPLGNDLLFDALKKNKINEPVMSKSPPAITKPDIADDDNDGCHFFIKRFNETLKLLDPISSNNNESKSSCWDLNSTDFHIPGIECEDDIFTLEHPKKLPKFDGLLIKHPKKPRFIDEIECRIINSVAVPFVEHSQTSHHSPESIANESQFLWTADLKEIGSKYADQLMESDEEVHETSDILLAEFKTPIQAKAIQRIKGSVKPRKNSPLLQAFSKMETKQNAVLVTPESEKRIILQNRFKSNVDFYGILQFFGLNSIDELFAEDDDHDVIVIADEDDLDDFQPSTSTPLKAGPSDARKLFATSNIKNETTDSFKSRLAKDFFEADILEDVFDGMECNSELSKNKSVHVENLLESENLFGKEPSAVDASTEKRFSFDCKSNSQDHFPKDEMGQNVVDLPNEDEFLFKYATESEDIFNNERDVNNKREFSDHRLFEESKKRRINFEDEPESQDLFHKDNEADEIDQHLFYLPNDEDFLFDCATESQDIFRNENAVDKKRHTETSKAQSFKFSNKTESLEKLIEESDYGKLNQNEPFSHSKPNTSRDKKTSQKNIVIELDDDMFADESSIFRNLNENSFDEIPEPSTSKGRSSIIKSFVQSNDDHSVSQVLAMLDNDDYTAVKHDARNIEINRNESKTSALKTNTSDIPVITQGSSFTSSCGLNRNIQAYTPKANISSDVPVTTSSSATSSCGLNKNIEIGDLDEIFADEIFSNSSDGDCVIPCSQGSYTKNSNVRLSNMFAPADTNESTSVIREITPPIEVISMLDDTPAKVDLKSPSMLGGRRPNISRLQKMTPRRIDSIPFAQKNSPFFVTAMDLTQRANNIENRPVNLNKFRMTQASQLGNESIVGGFAPRNKRIIVSSDEDEVFATCRTHTSSTQKSAQSARSSTKQQSQKKIIKKRRRVRCQFVDDEVGVSGSDSGDLENSDEMSDHYDTSIIDDDPNVENGIVSTQLHQMYVKSIRSPLAPVAFRVPKLKPMPAVDIYSQHYVPDDTSYKENSFDSFVVDEDEHDKDEDDGELSLLEIAERRLKKMRKERRKLKMNPNSAGHVKKRRRIMTIESNSSSEG